MIKINLLPEEFRIVKKEKAEIPYTRIAIGLGILFGILTGSFYLDYMNAQKELKKLEQTWATLQPQSAQLKALESEVETTLKPERDFLTKYVLTAKPLTFLLVWISEFMPDTAWLTEVKMEQSEAGQNLFIKGLVLPSKEKSSIELIEIFFHQLKEKIPESLLSLTTTRQKLESVEVTQFIANFEWKAV